MRTKTVRVMRIILRVQLYAAIIVMSYGFNAMTRHNEDRMKNRPERLWRMARFLTILQEFYDIEYKISDIFLILYDVFVSV